jgi:hypothetical protein
MRRFGTRAKAGAFYSRRKLADQPIPLPNLEQSVSG